MERSDTEEMIFQKISSEHVEILRNLSIAYSAVLKTHRAQSEQDLCGSSDLVCLDGLGISLFAGIKSLKVEHSAQNSLPQTRQ